jgi:hypothetical protein
LDIPFASFLKSQIFQEKAIYFESLKQIIPNNNSVKIKSTERKNDKKSELKV